MTKANFEKIVKSKVVADGAKVVDIHTTIEYDDILETNYFVAGVIAIRNHIAHKYGAYTMTMDDDDVTVKYSKCLGA